MTVETFDYKLKVVDVQSMVFDGKGKYTITPIQWLNSQLGDMQLLDDKKELMKTKTDKVKVKEGYVITTKRFAQVLLERGLWIDKMKLKLDVDDPLYPNMSVSTVLANWKDFREEIDSMEKLVGS